MSKFALLPIFFAAAAAMLTWVMVRHMELSEAQRATAALQPRSRPYATKLPDSLIQH